MVTYYVIVFTQNDINFIIKNNEYNLVKYLFETITKVKNGNFNYYKLKRFFNDYTSKDTKCFSLFYCIDIHHLSFSTENFLSKKSKENYIKKGFKNVKHYFYDFKPTIRKEKLKKS